MTTRLAIVWNPLEKKGETNNAEKLCASVVMVEIVIFTYVDKGYIIAVMNIVERNALDFGVEHFRGVTNVLEVAAGDNQFTAKHCVNPVVFESASNDLLYILTDVAQKPGGAGKLKSQEPGFDRPGLAIRYEEADATKLSQFYRSFDVVFMRNFLGDPTIFDDTKCEAVEESLLCLRTPKTAGASALWAIETYTPDVAEWFVGKLLDAFPIFSVERARVSSQESQHDPRFSAAKYPIALNNNPEYRHLQNLAHPRRHFVHARSV